MELPERLIKHRTDILDLAQRRGASNVRVFGSQVRGTQRADSDVDFLVDFEQGRSLLNHASLIDDLARLLGCPVDVASSRSLDPGMQSRIFGEAVPL